MKTSVKKDTVWCQKLDGIKIIIKSKKIEDDVVITFIRGGDASLTHYVERWFLSDFLLYHEFIA